MVISTFFWEVNLSHTTYFDPLVNRKDFNRSSHTRSFHRQGSFSLNHIIDESHVFRKYCYNIRWWVQCVLSVNVLLVICSARIYSNTRIRTISFVWLLRMGYIFPMISCVFSRLYSFRWYWNIVSRAIVPELNLFINTAPVSPTVWFH